MARSLTRIRGITQGSSRRMSATTPPSPSEPPPSPSSPTRRIRARAVACACVRESCAIRDDAQAKRLLHSLVVAPSSRGNNDSARETASRREAFAFRMGAMDVVTVWCEPGLVDWYVEEVWVHAQAPMGRASDDRRWRRVLS